MRRRRLIWVAVLASFVAAHVLPAPSVEAGGYTRRTLLLGQQFPEAICVLVDNSGSMSGSPYACAVRQARWVTEQASDGARVRFATFGSEVAWQDPDPAKWVKLPDAEAVAVSVAWLQHRGGEFGVATYIAEAVEAALALDESPLGVVVISDCAPTDGMDATRERIKAANAKRKSGPAVVGVVLVGAGVAAKDFALLVAADGGGPAVELQAKEDPPIGGPAERTGAAVVLVGRGHLPPLPYGCSGIRSPVTHGRVPTTRPTSYSPNWPSATASAGARSGGRRRGWSGRRKRIYR